MDLTGKGVGMDFGIFIKSKTGANLALMIQDLNSRYQWKTDKIFERGKVYIEQFPTLYRVGSTFDYSDVYFTADAGVVMNGGEVIDFSARLGAEYIYMDHYYLRGGFGNGRVGVGLGLDWSLFEDQDSRLDYAFSSEDNKLQSKGFSRSVDIFWSFSKISMFAFDTAALYQKVPSASVPVIDVLLAS